jgi:hypothetical protein
LSYQINLHWDGHIDNPPGVAPEFRVRVYRTRFLGHARGISR